METFNSDQQMSLTVDPTKKLAQYLALDPSLAKE